MPYSHEEIKAGNDRYVQTFGDKVHSPFSASLLPFRARQDVEEPLRSRRDDRGLRASVEKP